MYNSVLSLPSMLYALRYMFYHLHSTLFLLILIVLNFLTKTSEQHKGKLLVVVSFFVYFRRVSSLSETSSGNDYY